MTRRAQKRDNNGRVKVGHRFVDDNKVDGWLDVDGNPLPSGWYYFPCFPGCPQKNNAIGPFESAAEAVAAARRNNLLGGFLTSNH